MLAIALIACAEGVTEKRTADDDDGGSGGSGASGGAASSGGGGTGPSCGNGVRELPELCDGEDFGGQSCEMLGFLGGPLICDESCNISTTACFNESCGNGIKEGTEACDGDDLAGQSCSGLGYAGGALACSGECTFEGCHDAYAQDFEGGALPAGMTSSGAAQWFISTIQPHAGSFAAQSGTIGHNQSTSLFLTLTFDTGGTISFWHRESSESGYDYLDFFVGALLQGSWSGQTGWSQATINVAAGTHTLHWRYSKDGSVSSGSDAVWIDDITVTGGYLP
jgi:hypothetical protein